MIKAGWRIAALGRSFATLDEPLPSEHSKVVAEHLLRYYSRVAGLPEDAGFETTDDFVAWAREHRPDLDLSRRPRMPAGLVR